jgi:O-antigen ligase
MNRDALDNFFERGILALVLGILVFGPLAMGAVDAWAFLIVQGLTMGVMVFWGLRLWFSPKPQILWPPICWVVLAFVIYAVARHLTADVEYVARLEMIQVLVCAFLFFAIVNNLYRQEFSQIISFTLIFLAAGISCFAAYQFLRHTNRVWNFTSPYAGRASGTYISPNNLAGFLEMILPLSVAYILAGRIKPVTRIVLGYAAIGIGIGLVLTFSRGGWTAGAAAIMGLLVILIFHRNHRIPALLLLFVLIGGGSFVAKNYLEKSLTYMDRVQGTLAGGQDVLDFRRGMWDAAEEMWRDNFWWGVGPAHYDYRFRQYRPEHIQNRPDRAHNDYLNLLADWGTVGGIIVLSGMTVFIIGLFQTRNHVRRAEKDFGSGMSNRLAFFLGASMGLLALAIHSVVDFNLHIPANAILGVTLLALLTSNLRFATERYWLNMRLPLKIVTTTALAAGIFYLGAQELRCARETCWLARADKPGLSSLDRAAVLEKAFDAEPMNFAVSYEIGEAYRLESFDGGSDYEKLAQTAMDWYSRGMKLNRYDGYNYLRYGMCLDWLDRHDEAAGYFSRANDLDPNGYYTVDYVGWHYFQIGDYAAARSWFERSLRLEWHESNVIARSYLDLTEQKLEENASGKGGLPAGF